MSQGDPSPTPEVPTHSQVSCARAAPLSAPVGCPWSIAPSGHAVGFSCPRPISSQVSSRPEPQLPQSSSPRPGPPQGGLPSKISQSARSPASYALFWLLQLLVTTTLQLCAPFLFFLFFLLFLLSLRLLSALLLSTLGPERSRPTCFCHGR
jgi:hypothetical protein